MNISIQNNNIQAVNIIINGVKKSINKADLDINDYIYDLENEEIIDNRVNDEFGNRKLNAMKIEKAYLNIGRVSKAQRLSLCWSRLEFFKRYNNKKLKLIWANSCRVRLCPSCAWRRSLKYYSENKVIFDELKKIAPGNRFLFLTLTIKNCNAENLKSEIERIIEGYHRLLKYKDLKGVILGSVRGLEITYNEYRNTYHPHIHAILVVQSNYFTKNYVVLNKWLKLWQKACGLDYQPNIDIRPFKENIKGTELAEVSKYIIKFSDILNLNDRRLSEVVSTLDSALNNKRAIGYSGILKNIRSELKYKDDISEDIEIDINPDEEGYKLIYNWHNSNKKYIREF